MDQKEKDIFWAERQFRKQNLPLKKMKSPLEQSLLLKKISLLEPHNLTEPLNDVTAHAEMQAITSASSYLGVNI